MPESAFAQVTNRVPAPSYACQPPGFLGDTNALTWGDRTKTYSDLRVQKVRLVKWDVAIQEQGELALVKRLHETSERCPRCKARKLTLIDPEDGARNYHECDDCGLTEREWKAFWWSLRSVPTTSVAEEGE